MASFLPSGSSQNGRGDSNSQKEIEVQVDRVIRESKKGIN